MRFELFDLKLFAAIVEQGSLSKAAVQLPLALSAASTRLKTLESRLGLQLLLRGARGVEPTDAGKLFYEHACRVLKVASEAEEGMAILAGRGRSQIRLVSNTTGLSTRLPSQISEYLVANPSVDILFEQRSSRDGVQAVASGKADIGIVDGEYNQSDLLFLLYQRNQLAVMVHRDHALASESSCRFSRCLEEPLIGYESVSSLQQFIQRMAILAHQAAKFRATVPNFNSLAQLVAKNIGVAILPRPLADNFVKAHPLAVLELAEPWATRELHVCVRPESSLAMPVLKLARHLARISP